MNDRRFSWLTVTFVLLVCSQTLTAQLPEPRNTKATGDPAATQQPAGTFIYSDRGTAPATSAQTQEPSAPATVPSTSLSEQKAALENERFIQKQVDRALNSQTASPATMRQPFKTTPVRPANSLFYSDINTSVYPAAATTTKQPRKITTPKQDRTLFYSDTPQSVTPTPLPTIEYPAGARSDHDITGSRLWTNNQVRNFYNRPTTIGQLVNQDTSNSPSDVNQSPAQKACSKWCRTINVWGEFLYLRSRDSEVTYAVETNSAVAPPTPPVQVGRVGMVDQTGEPGFRIGITYLLDEFSSLTASWAMLETHRVDRIDRTSFANVIESMAIHPTTPAAASSGTFAIGTHDIDFDLVDIEYRGLISSCDIQETNYVIGVRYVYLQQEFFHNTDILGSETVATDIDFNGVGVRLGFEGERFRHKSRCFFYGKTYVNFIAGEFNAKYDQGQTFDASVVDTMWEAGRIVSIWDLELGFGHVCKSERWRLSAGYTFSAWTNVVKTDEFINAVQTNNFLDLGDTMTFDGIVARVEGRF